MAKAPKGPASVDPLAGLGPDEVLTIAQAAKRLGVNHKSIRDAIRSGVLRAHLPPGANPIHPGRYRYTIQPADLAAWWMSGYSDG